MKKITLFAIAALLLALASCSKEQIQSEQESGRTFSMTLNASVNETKATMSDAWKFAFSTGDKISLTNNQVTAGTYYELTRGSDGNFTGTVTAPSAAATWYAYYPSNNVSLSGQTGTQTGTAAYCALAGKQENVAAGSKNLNISLSFQTAILAINNQKGAIDINVKTSDGKWVSGFTAKENDATFDITKSDTKVSLLTATATGTYYVVVPAGVKISVYEGDTKINETKDAGLTAGKYYNIYAGFIDLGVKNSDGKSLYWAECNLGADNPQDPGDYYMWGATALMYSAVDYAKKAGAFTFVTENPYGDNYKNTWDASKGFAWNNAPFTDGVYNNSDNKNVFTKYTTIDTYAKSGTPDNMTTLEDKDDAATAKNASWRMPTIDDFKSLVANCVLVWTSDYNSTGKAGYIVYKAKNEADKGKANMNGTWKMWDAANSKYNANTGSEPTGYSTSDIHIFLPAAGNGIEANLKNYNIGGIYWSSSLATNNDLAFALIVMSGGIQISGGQRQYGYTIRPVIE